MKLYFFACFLLCWPLTGLTQPLCPKTPGLDQCLNSKLQQVVTQLESNLFQIEARYQHNTALLVALEQSQVQWNAYRKQECSNVFQLWQDKPDQQLMTASCSIQLGRDRNRFLQQTYLTD